MIPGAHVSVRGGHVGVPERLEKLGLGCGQVFTSNQQQWRGRSVPESESGIYGLPGDPAVISHSSYLINLASTRGRVAAMSRVALGQELERMRLMGIGWCVMHPGAHLGSGPEEGMRKIADGVRAALEEAAGEVGILYENTAGQGTSIGYSLEQLQALMDMTGLPERVGICFDTCHGFAAGYDLSSPEAVGRTLDRMASEADLSRIRAFHINDSKRELGSGRDRHANAGEGLIGLEPLRALASRPEFEGIPAIAETPGTDEDRARDILSVIR